MKRITDLLIVGPLALALALPAVQAATPREQLQDYVSHLRNSPTDQALREAIIRLVATMTPPPAIPEEARRYFVMGNTLQKDAKTPKDAEGAIGEYEQALLIAPWWPEAYFNLGTALELAGRYDGAKNALRLYLLTSPREGDAREAQDRIYAIEAKENKVNRDTAAAAEEEARKRTRVAKEMEGSWVNRGEDVDVYWRLQLTGEHRFRLERIRQVTKGCVGPESVCGSDVPREEVYDLSVQGRSIAGTGYEVLDLRSVGWRRAKRTVSVTGTIAEDGNSVELTTEGPEFSRGSREFSGPRQTLRFQIRRNR